MRLRGRGAWRGSWGGTLLTGRAVPGPGRVNDHGQVEPPATEAHGVQGSTQPLGARLAHVYEVRRFHLNIELRTRFRQQSTSLLDRPSDAKTLATSSNRHHGNDGKKGAYDDVGDRQL